jgi:hypothetical protein
MSRTHPEYGNLFDQSVVADLILRQEPGDEEDEEEDQDDAWVGPRFLIRKRLRASLRLGKQNLATSAVAEAVKAAILEGVHVAVG